MCGIFSYLGTKYNDNELLIFANKISHRGPDSTISKRINNKLFFTFHRLAINGLNNESNQPFEKDGIFLICNGEIFNYKNLIDIFDLKDDYKSDSDCEIIIHLFIKFGIEKTCKLLDGEFSFIIYDSNKNILYAARDQLGVRSLYWGQDDEQLFFCSELKGIPQIDDVNQFPPSSYWDSNTNSIRKFYDFSKNSLVYDDEDEIIENIHNL
jgi:asparagine synthase (glutamine-hydrolysing)